MPAPQDLAIPSYVEWTHGPGGLPGYRLKGKGGEAFVLLHGAHITAFAPEGAAPVLWMSAQSHFADGKPVRGGIPICWPWFGPHATDPQRPAHGIARLRAWTALDSAVLHDGRVRLRLAFVPRDHERALVPEGLRAEISITVGRELDVELTTLNESDAPLAFEDALHSYFGVADLGAARVEGLHDCPYTDKLDGKRIKIQEGSIRFIAETDRVYHDRGSATELWDAAAGRQIRIGKRGSASTVVWNPWIDKSKAMPDFGDDEWTGMCCVETANVGADRVLLLPGGRHTTRLCLSVG